jgi:hypothetical protein
MLGTLKDNYNLCSLLDTVHTFKRMQRKRCEEILAEKEPDKEIQGPSSDILIPRTNSFSFFKLKDQR